MNGGNFIHAEPVSPDDCLGSLLANLVYDEPLSASAREWAVRGILRAIRRNEPLDTSLRLTGCGRDNLSVRLALVSRDEHLTAAFENVTFDATVTTWQRFTRLATEVKKFNAHTWPKTKRLQAPPTDWPALKKSLWHAAATDHALPESAQALRECVKRNGGFSQSKTGSKLLASFL